VIYLIHYDRAIGKLVSMRQFSDEERDLASQMKLALEISLLGELPASEVVLLEAPSEEHLRTTHRRYFETLNGLKSQERKA
jgi:hypothetical protein